MQNNRQNLAILFFTMVVVMMGFGMIIPILPFYIIGLSIDFAPGNNGTGCCHGPEQRFVLVGIQ